MGFQPIGRLDNPFRRTDPRLITTDRTFKRVVYFEEDAVFSSGASAQALVRSANFSVVNELGWGADGAGNAWFFGTTTLGGGTVLLADLYSDNWDGSIPASLPDGAATTGYYLDHSAGAAQFRNIYAQGGELADMTLSGELTVQDNITLSTAGAFRTAASGKRVEMSTTQFDRVSFFTGNDSESVEGRIFAADVSSIPSLEIFGPSLSGGINDLNAIQLVAGDATNSYGVDITSVTQHIRLSASTQSVEIWAGGSLRADFSSTINQLNGATYTTPTFADGALALRIDIERAWEFKQWGTGSSTGLSLESTSNKPMRIGNVTSGDYVVFMDGRVRADPGTVALPSHTFNNDPDTGFYRSSTNQISVATGGTSRGFINSNGWHLAQMSTTGNAANTWAQSTSSNRMYRVTSARKYKTEISYDTGFLADYELRPATFWREDDQDWFIDFIADDIGEQDTRMGEYDENGDIENYHKPAVMAVLAAKQNRTDTQVRALQAECAALRDMVQSLYEKLLHH